MSECWCREVHPERADDLPEAWATLWHAVVGAIRIPALMDWLARRMSSR